MTSLTEMTSSVVIFTDGACSGNPGPGGWGSIVALPDQTIHELGGGNKDTTNNRMEMVAAIRALAILEPASTSSTILLYTDSTYMISGITKSVWKWRNNNWKTSTGTDVANRDLWEELVRHSARLKPTTIDWRYVRGHSGYPGNERCDVIAVSFAKGKHEPLYVGPRDGYFVDLENLPDPEQLPERSSSGSSAGSARNGYSGGGKSSGPVTYLSYYNGVLLRHSTWGACERVVKGHNAKFKKAKSPQEEREILVSWGLDPDTPIA